MGETVGGCSTEHRVRRAVLRSYHVTVLDARQSSFNYDHGRSEATIAIFYFHLISLNFAGRFSGHSRRPI
jgi:hypothetical protein